MFMKINMSSCICTTLDQSTCKSCNVGITKKDTHSIMRFKFIFSIQVRFGKHCESKTGKKP